MRLWIILLALAASLAHAESVAVLPFGNLSAVPNASGMDWMGASVSESVRATLDARRVEVLSREEVLEAYAGLRLRPLAALTQASILKVAGALKTDYSLYGTINYQPPKLTIAARVWDRRRLTQVAAFEEIGTLDELSALEAHLSWRALKFLAPAAAPAESEYLSLRPPVRLDAEESYIRGLLATPSEQREMYFLQAARQDSRDWRPAFELGKILMTRKAYREAAPWLEQVQQTDSSYAEAGFLLGVAKFHANDMAAAEEIFERLSRTVPLGGIFNNLGAAQSRNGKPAAAAFRAALRDNPNNPAYHFNLGNALWKANEFDAAVESFHAALDRNPSDTMATLLLGRSLKKQGPRKADPADARLLALERIEESFADLGYRRRGKAE